MRLASMRRIGLFVGVSWSALSALALADDDRAVMIYAVDASGSMGEQAIETSSLSKVQLASRRVEDELVPLFNLPDEHLPHVFVLLGDEIFEPMRESDPQTAIQAKLRAFQDRFRGTFSEPEPIAETLAKFLGSGRLQKLPGKHAIELVVFSDDEADPSLLWRAVGTHLVSGIGHSVINVRVFDLRPPLSPWFHDFKDAVESAPGTATPPRTVDLATASALIEREPVVWLTARLQKGATLVDANSRLATQVPLGLDVACSEALADYVRSFDLKVLAPSDGLFGSGSALVPVVANKAQAQLLEPMLDVGLTDETHSATHNLRVSVKPRIKSPTAKRIRLIGAHGASGDELLCTTSLVVLNPEIKVEVAPSGPTLHQGDRVSVTISWNRDAVIQMLGPLHVHWTEPGRKSESRDCPLASDKSTDLVTFTVVGTETGEATLEVDGYFKKTFAIAREEIPAPEIDVKLLADQGVGIDHAPLVFDLSPGDERIYPLVLTRNDQTKDDRNFAVTVENDAKACASVDLRVENGKPFAARATVRIETGKQREISVRIRVPKNALVGSSCEPRLKLACDLAGAILPEPMDLHISVVAPRDVSIPAETTATVAPDGGAAVATVALTELGGPSGGIAIRRSGNGPFRMFVKFGEQNVKLDFGETLDLALAPTADPMREIELAYERIVEEPIPVSYEETIECATPGSENWHACRVIFRPCAERNEAAFEASQADSPSAPGASVALGKIQFSLLTPCRLRFSVDRSGIRPEIFDAGAPVPSDPEGWVVVPSRQVQVRCVAPNPFVAESYPVSLRVERAPSLLPSVWAGDVEIGAEPVVVGTVSLRCGRPTLRLAAKITDGRLFVGRNAKAGDDLPQTVSIAAETDFWPSTADRWHGVIVSRADAVELAPPATLTAEAPSITALLRVRPEMDRPFLRDQEETVVLEVHSFEGLPEGAVIVPRSLEVPASIESRYPPARVAAMAFAALAGLILLLLIARRLRGPTMRGTLSYSRIGSSDRGVLRLEGRNGRELLSLGLTVHGDPALGREVDTPYAELRAAGGDLYVRPLETDRQVLLGGRELTKEARLVPGENSLLMGDYEISYVTSMFPTRADGESGRGEENRDSSMGDSGERRSTADEDGFVP